MSGKSGRGSHSISRQTFLGEGWWISELWKCLEGAYDPEIIRKGNELANKGIIAITSISDGLVSAKVQENVITDTSLQFRTFNTDEWGRIQNILREHPSSYELIRSGDYPAALESLCKEAGLPIIPQSGDITWKCSCTGSQVPCMHGAGLFCELIRMIHEDLSLLFTIRGKTIHLVEHEPSQQIKISNICDVKDWSKPEFLRSDKKGFYEPKPELGLLTYNFPKRSGRERNIIRLCGSSPFILEDRNLSEWIEEIYPISAQYVRTILRLGNNK